MKFPTYEEMAQNVAEKALDEYEYKGKTLREWVEIIAAFELSTNLAEVGTDAISRRAAIDALYSVDEYNSRSVKAIKQLPPIQPKRGRWIDGYCSECGAHAPFWAMASTYHKSNFCPNCGVDMRGEQE